MNQTIQFALVLLCCAAHSVAQPIDDAKAFGTTGDRFWYSLRVAGLIDPSGIAMTSDGAAFYVADYESHQISLFDTAGGCLFEFPEPDIVAPTGLAISPDDALVYVCSAGTDDVRVFDAVGNLLLVFPNGTLTAPADIAVTSDGAAVYVASRGSGDIRVFDAVGDFLFAFGIPSLDPSGVIVTADDAVVYVASSASNTIEAFTCDGQHLGSVASIESPSDVIVAWDDAVLYAVSVGGNAVAVFDNQGISLLTMPGSAQLNGRSQVVMGLEDASFAVTNFGRLPRPGDLNCDELVNFGDINAFVLALTNPTTYRAVFPECDQRNADVNADCAVDFGDINPFVALLSGGG